MNSIIVSPYTGDGQSDETAFRPLISEVLPGVSWRDATSRPMSDGIPAINMLVVETDLSGSQLSQIKSDDRFFVLKPGPGNKGGALLNWLTSKSATGHNVKESDDEATVISKLIVFCRH